MSQKKTLPLLIFLILPILLAACSEPEPMTQESLDAINCQPGDLPRDQVYEAIESRQPSLEFLMGNNPTFLSNKTWNDISSSRQTFSCTIFMFDDFQLAQNAIQRACDELHPPFRIPDIGELSCQDGEQEMNVIYQQGPYLVWIWADFRGQGILDVAERISDKLRDR